MAIYLLYHARSNKPIRNEAKQVPNPALVICLPAALMA